MFDAIFGAHVRLERVHFGPLPFVAITHDAGLLRLAPGRIEFTLEGRTGGAGRSWEDRIAWVRGSLALTVAR